MTLTPLLDIEQAARDAALVQPVCDDPFGAIEADLDAHAATTDAACSECGARPAQAYGWSFYCKKHYDVSGEDTDDAALIDANPELAHKASEMDEPEADVIAAMVHEGLSANYAAERLLAAELSRIAPFVNRLAAHVRKTTTAVFNPPRTDIVYSDGYVVTVRGRVVARCETLPEAEQARNVVLHGGEFPGHIVTKVCRCNDACGDGVHECATFGCWIAMHNGMMLEMECVTEEAAERLLIEFVARVGQKAWAA